MSAKITPFDLSSLPSISKAYIITKKAADYLKSLNQIVSDTVSLALTSLSSSFELNIHFQSCFPTDKNEFLKNDSSLRHHFISAVYGDQEFPIFIKLEVDAASHFVYQLLSKSTQEERAFDGISPVEEGVFLFMLSVIFKRLKTQFAIEAEVRLFPMDQSCFSKLPLKKDYEMAQILGSLEIGKNSSFFSVFLPLDLLQCMLQCSKPTNQFPTIEPAFLNFIEIPVSVTLQEMKTSQNELQNLEIGDVIILNANPLSFDEQSASGPIDCRLGAGGNKVSSSIPAELSVNDSGYYVLHF